jgi:hypothetical protein
VYELIAEPQDQQAPCKEQQILEHSEDPAQGSEEPRVEQQEGKPRSTTTNLKLCNIFN